MGAIKGFLSSKKGIGTLVGMVLNVLLAVGVVPTMSDEARADAVKGITGLIAAYVIGQGVADHGKEAAKEKAKAAAATGSGNGGGDS